MRMYIYNKSRDESFDKMSPCVTRDMLKARTGSRKFQKRDTAPELGTKIFSWQYVITYIFRSSLLN